MKRLHSFLCHSLFLGLALVARGADPLSVWHLRTAPMPSATEDLEGVAYGNGRWVIVGGGGTICSSADGVEWVRETNPAGTAHLDDVTFGNGLFVAIGSGNNVVLTSADGRQWTRQAPKSGGGVEIIHDGMRFITLMAGGFLTASADGVQWEGWPRIPTLYNDAGGIAHANGTYVEVGYMRTGKPTDLWSSVGLENWEFREAKSNENMQNVGYGLGQFVAVGMDGTVITSPDGVVWTLRPVPHTGFIWDVCAGGSQLAAACQWGRILTSPDGVNWTRQQTPSSTHLTDIAFGNGTFVAVGWDGALVQSDPIAAAPGPIGVALVQPRLDPDQFRFQLRGEVGGTYEIQSSADLAVWMTVANVTCTASPMDCSVPLPGPAGRFYRAIRR